MYTEKKRSYLQGFLCKDSYLSTVSCGLVTVSALADVHAKLQNMLLMSTLHLAKLKTLHKLNVDKVGCSIFLPDTYFKKHLTVIPTSFL